MAIFTQYEKEVLKKFKNGGYVTTQKDKEVVDDLASIGLILRGYDWEKKCGTARLSDSCIKNMNI